jgi:3-oxosteroid 1-dehydrogenase
MSSDATQWDHECDVLIVGSGNGGLSAALTSHYHGLDTLVIEKMAFFGGSSALSGGGVWIPNNPVNVKAGVKDSIEDARTYLDAVVGDRVPAARREAYLQAGPAMLELLMTKTRHVRYMRVPGYSDYHPEAPGGAPDGRSVEPVPVDARLLGEDAERLNRTNMLKPPGGLWLTTKEYRRLLLVLRNWQGKRTALKVGVRTALTRLSGRQMLSLGAAGVARLRLAAKEAGIPVWLETPLRELIVEDGKVVGVRAERDSSSINIRARRGVILAAGGFEHNEEMRHQYQQEPITTAWTSGSPGNTGDAIQAGLAIGAGVDLMDDAWWGPSMDAKKFSIFLLAERMLPGSIIVNGEGERYFNEAAPYVNFVHAMYDGHKSGTSHIPSYLIIDQRYRNRYPFSTVPPRKAFPKSWVKNEIVVIADTIAELAGKLGLPPEGLEATVARYNELVAGGRDLDFGKGDSAYDRYYGDPTIKPNPNLSPIDHAPYYAVKIVPGDLGTKGGLVCDEHSRVLREDGSVIDGLYATGNTSASPMGNEYPGAGGTLGPAM